MRRRLFLRLLSLGVYGLASGSIAEESSGGMIHDKASRSRQDVTLFLCGDVMTGRGIDQVLPHPSHPRIHEDYLKSAADYVKIAELANGPIPKPVAFDYIWGDALTEFQRLEPDLRVINLETAVTTSEDYWPNKGINYRMHPDNIPCLTAAGIDVCILANNHVLDWGHEGLRETLETLDNAGIKTVGAGTNRAEAEAPAIFDLPSRGRLLLFAYSHWSSGVPKAWQAAERQPGVSLLTSLSKTTVARIADHISALRQPDDLVLVSLHWGGNWGYKIPPEQQHFAHQLIDLGLVDVVHGHSSHHPKGIEVYQEHPIFYGCGDFINDYEGIGGYEAFRDDLTLMYFLTLDHSGKLKRLVMTPLQVKNFRLRYPSEHDRHWLQKTMHRECALLGTQLTQLKDGRFEVA
jgi:poly-gamma-glutamate synthesis protein (capsule biosynthesis protein)